MTSQAPDSYIEGMEEMASMVADFRANVAPETHLGSESIDGTQSRVNFQKSHSKIRMGDVELPERIPLYNKVSQTMRMVPPTIAQSRIMKGSHAYPASAYTLRDPGFAPPAPIDETCPVCNARRASFGQPPRRFYDEAQLDAHFESLHPRAFRTAERRRQDDMRREDQGQMRELIASIRDALAGQDVTDEEAEEIAEGAIRRRGRRAAG